MAGDIDMKVSGNQPSDNSMEKVVKPLTIGLINIAGGGKLKPDFLTSFPVDALAITELDISEHNLRDFAATVRGARKQVIFGQQTVLAKCMKMATTLGVADVRQLWQVIRYLLKFLRAAVGIA